MNRPLLMFCGLTLCACAGMMAGRAAASTFDAATGRLSLDDADYAIALDSYSTFPPELPLTLYDLQQSPLNQIEVSALFAPDPEGLEGEGALRLRSEDAYFGNIQLGGLPDTFIGRRVEMRIWQKPEGTLWDLSLAFYADGAAFNGGLSFGSVPFRPTGRVTSDGWREYSTGPFDYAVGGEVEPAYLLLSDQQVAILQQSYAVGYNYNAATRLDALEIVDVGPALVPNASCTLVDEYDVCGAQGTCLHGRCADTAIVDGPAPLDDAARADYVTRRRFEYMSYEGGRIPQTLMGPFDTAMQGLIDNPADAAFWPTFKAAVDGLQDGHASAPYMSYPTQLMGGVCLGLGDADLLPAGGTFPLVFAAGGNGPLSSALQDGDVLVAIDGLAPFDWAALAPRYVGHGGDPRAAQVVITPSLMNAALRTGATLTFERCTPTDGVTPCAAQDVEVIDLDLAALLGDPIFGPGVPNWLYDAPPCDQRFRRRVNSAQVTDYNFAGSIVDGDGITTLLINGVPGSQSPEGQAWHSQVMSAAGSQAPLMMLDQRTGRGGTIEGVDALVSYLINPNDYYSADMLTWWEDEAVTYQKKEDTMDCVAQSGFFSPCGGGTRWPLGLTGTGFGQSSSTKLAILNAMDVSGNDYTTKALSFRSGPTRIFGAGSTHGAFGVIWNLPTYYGELIGGSFQVHDSIFLASSGDTNLDFNTSIGLTPEVETLQKQSDAIAGVDTVIEAARAWLLEN